MLWSRLGNGHISLTAAGAVIELRSLGRCGGLGCELPFPHLGQCSLSIQGWEEERKDRQCNKNTKWANICMFFEKIFIIIYMENIRLCDLKV